MKESAKNLIAIVLIAAGAMAMFVGLHRGEAADILQKATKICLECIGIG